ncbi:MAG: thioester reductase domain-containing protein [Chthoniobacteraceae bacterium]
MKTPPPPRSEPIAITGIGCRFPGGARTPEAFWKLLCAGTDTIAEVSPDRWSIGRYFNAEPGKPGKTYSKWAGLIEGIDQFDAQFFGFNPREAACIDPQQRLLLEATWEAFEDAGQPIDFAHGSNTGVFVGVSTNDYGILQATGDDITTVDAYSTTGSTMSLAANRISYCFNFRGPSVPVDTACSSSLVAVHLACAALRNGECEMAIAGGVNVIAGAIPFIAFSSMAMLSPDGHCKAFDASANGFVRGEGVGAVLLKPLSAALAAGDRIHAVILATGVNQDGRTPGITVPSQHAQEALVVQTCREAGIAPASVQYVEAHGTGTPVGDPIEANALGSALSRGRANGRECVIGSAKTNIGHLESAAGVAGIIKAALALEHGLIPPSLHFKEPNPQIDFEKLKLRVPLEVTAFRDGKIRPIAGVNSFGWGGTNAHALLEAPPRRKALPAGGSKRAWLLPISARSPEALIAAARGYADFLRQPATPALRDIANTTAVRRTHLEHRIAFAGRTKAELARRFDEFARGESRRLPSQPGTDRKIAFVFSGQGPQWWRMGRDLLAREPVFRAKIEECDALLAEIAGWSLLDELTADEAASRLDHTGFAQPAIFALQVALAALWRSWGIEPAGVIGHSVGEVAAAHVAGIFDLREAVRVIFHRGDTMEHVTAEGRMLAAGMSAEDAQKAIGAHPGRVFLAAVNSPSSVTLSGEPAALTALAAELDAQQIFTRPVPVKYAFHSAQMDPVKPVLRKALAGLAPGAATIPIASTVTGRLASGSDFDAAYWWHNVRDTVQFAAGIESLIDSGFGNFIELSPHPVLGAAVHECLSHRGERGAVLASLERQTDDQVTMLSALGALHSLGHPVKWDALFPHGAQFVPVPAYPWQRTLSWHESEASRELRLKAPSHPFLDRRVRSADPCWEVKLDRRLFPYLSDHRVQGRALFPGAGFLEMALGAAREIFGPGTYVLENVDFLKALFLPETDERPTLQITYFAADSSFVIASCAHESGRTWTTHATGKMRLETKASPPARAPLKAALARCMSVGETEAFYRLLYEVGLQYGPTFRGIEQLWRRDLETVAQVSLPERIAGEAGSYLVHPAYLDACFQPGFTALPVQKFHDETGIFLPVHVDRVQYFSAPEPSGWVHGEITECSARSCAGNFLLVDSVGDVRVQLTGCRWLLLEGTSRELDDWLFDLQWHLKPLTSGNAPRRTHDFFPGTASLARLLNAEAATPRDRSRTAAQLDELTVALVLRAFTEMGWKPRRGEHITTRNLSKRFRVATNSADLLGRVLLLLEGAGVLRKRKDGAEWIVARTPRFSDVAESWRTILSHAPAFAPALTLLDRSGLGLGRLLRGEVDSHAMFFPDGSVNVFEHFCADSPLFRPAHRLVEKAVAHAVARLPEGRTLRILELGASNGAATARILPRLRPDRVDYLFTDPSEKFLTEPQRKFQDFPFVRFQTLDIRRDAVAQGIEAHSMDLIIAANAFDGIRDAAAALANARALLAPGGLLVLSGMQRAPRWFELLFGILHPEFSLRGGAEWQRLLEVAGFIDVAVIEAGAQTLCFARAAVEAVAEIEPEIVAEPARRWLIFADDSGCADAFAAQLRQRGHECELVPRGASAEPASIQSANEIVHLWSLDAPSPDGLATDGLDEAQSSGCLSVLNLVQAIAARETVEPPALWLVTRGAQAAGETSHPVSVAQAPLVGLARVIRTEHPNFRCRVVDLCPTRPSNEVQDLLAELLADEKEDEIALRGETRYVQRVGRGSLQPRPLTTKRFVNVHRHPCRLEIPKPGLLDRLTLTPITRRKPKPDEVEIEVAAAGLNFRDVMKTLGIYPTDAEDATILGDECAGRIVAVGTKVRGLRIGDEVMAIAPGCFASHVTIHSALVLPKPPRVTFEEAATMLIAYLTASYALHHLGHLRRGERVLIHAAAGGVGFAAVRLAQQAGAEIFATAGSAEKRDFLRSCGVPHVMDSRTLAFADEVMTLTGGRGVDIVLNSLAGEAIPKSLAVLGHGGRFLEIGKRDIYQDSKIGLRPFRNNLSFFAVDLSRAMQPEFIRDISGTLRRHFRTGRLSPLPFRTFPIGDAVGAFRYMAQARQIGKVVITMRGEEVAAQAQPVKMRSEFHRAGTCLITGGLGGFGLAVAQWMAVKGARHLVLMSRSGMTTDEARTAVKRMRAGGVKVVLARGDVSREEDVRKVLKLISRTLPPLRGVAHAAMVLDDAMLLQLDAARFRKVLAPKMRGGWNLHKLTQNLPLDFFLLFSSAAAVVGNPGQGNYAAANVFLDALAHHRHALGLPALSVNWGFLTELGYVARTPKIQEHFARLGWTGISPHKALRILARLLPTPLAQMTVAHIDWSNVPARMSGSPRYSLLMSEAGHGKEVRNDAAWIREAVMNVSPAEGRRIIENYLREQIAKVLRIPVAKLSLDRPLTELGLDSLMAVELINRVESQLGTAVPTGKLIGGPTIAKISAVVLEVLTGAVANTAAEEPAAPAGETIDFAAEIALDPALRFGATPVEPAQFTAPGIVFLTGATSFLGAFLLRDLLEKTTADIYCLLASPSVEEARRQIEITLEQYGLPADLSRIVPVLGELSVRNFGLTDSQFARLAKQVDTIFHAGAEAQHLVPYAQLKAANVDSIQSILRLATTARLKPVHHLSSVSVFMATSGLGASALREDDTLANPQHLGSGYGQTRWVAEKILELARTNGLPVNIYRPGLIVGDSRGGAAASEDAFWRLTKGCIELGSGPAFDVNIFLTAADYVSAATLALSRDPDLAGRTFHLVNPHQRTFADVLRAARNFGYDLEITSREAWEARIKAMAEERHASALLPYMLLIPGEFHDPLRRFRSAAEVDCRSAIAALEPVGIECPDVDDALLGRCFDYLVRTGFLTAPGPRRRTRTARSKT